MRLETLKNNPGCEWNTSDSTLCVFTSQALVQAAGHLKFNLAQEGKRVLFRGQRKRYSGLIPTMFRGEGTKPLKLQTIRNRQNEMEKRIKEVSMSKAFLKNTPELAKEPLLQHYGFNTSWLDVVDNVWVALWFAVHRAVVHKQNARLLHFEQRTVSCKDDDGFAYVLLIKAPKEADPNKVGFFRDGNCSLVDLREAAPSTYLRPHAQHGLLIKREALKEQADADLQDCVVGTIRVHLADAQNWLGIGSLLSVHNLFPPAGYDSGYACLLEKCPIGCDHLGSVQFVSP